MSPRTSTPPPGLHPCRDVQRAQAWPGGSEGGAGLPQRQSCGSPVLVVPPSCLRISRRGLRGLPATSVCGATLRPIPLRADPRPRVVGGAVPAGALTDGYRETTLGGGAEIGRTDGVESAEVAMGAIRESPRRTEEVACAEEASRESPRTDEVAFVEGARRESPTPARASLRIWRRGRAGPAGPGSSYGQARGRPTSPRRAGSAQFPASPTSGRRWSPAPARRER
jgi:hypothetical protein